MSHFTIEELTVTSTGLDNTPNDEQIAALNALVDNILDPLRDLLGAPITVNSGFRSQEVNARVGGVPTSQHTKGEAADIVCYDNQKLFDLIKANLPFDQVIDEYDLKWVHVSYSDRNRRQELKIG